MSQPTAEFLAEVKTKRLSALGIKREDVERLIAQRDALRAEKRWSEADAIRSELESKSILLMDGDHGAEWRVRIG